MRNPYAIDPPNIMPGMQMFGQSIQAYSQGKQRRAGFERERVKTVQDQKLRDEGAEILQKSPDEIASWVAKTKGGGAIIKEALGARSDAMLDIARRHLIGGEDAHDVLMEDTEKVIKEGGDGKDAIDLLKRSQTDPSILTKKYEKVFAALDPTGYKSFKSTEGGASGIDPAFKKQKTAAYLVKNAAGETQIVAGVFNPKDGTMTVEGGKLPEGFEPVSKLGETGIEETKRKIVQKKGEKIVTGQESRATSLIDRGITAAESTATIRRGIELLDSVKTGGYNNAALRAKQIFGIESADEGELSNSLGKSVLSQLRETFGAAFTENEGNRLARIEAAFGKSPEANKRLLQQALRLSERTAKRARDAAYKREDMDTVNDINDLLKFTLSDPNIETDTPAQPQNNEATQEQAGVQPQFTEGQTATGGKYIYTGGQWRLNQ